MATHCQTTARRRIGEAKNSGQVNSFQRQTKRPVLSHTDESPGGMLKMQLTLGHGHPFLLSFRVLNYSIHKIAI